MLTAKSFFDLSDFSHCRIFPKEGYVWEALKSLKDYMIAQDYPDLASLPIGKPLPKTMICFEGNFIDADKMEIEYGDATKGHLKVYKKGQQLAGASVIMAGAVLLGNQINLGTGVLIEPGAYINSPAIIGDQTEVRQGAYLRGNCLIGKKCVVGHVTEVKHSIFLDGAKAGHFAYLGDSILGNQVNLGAGTKMANLKFISGNIRIKTDNGQLDTGLRKMGAILGDHVQTGCNSVTNPGTLLGKKSFVLPNTTAPSGYHGANSIIR
ncbi:MAG: hypothetical protein KKB30_16125 [Proteobacteria bacterium]|nr:hypothetical protein [Pseudomonadota bacterium]MBU1713976.1 hypothetical protein [Pseudomonadota bacterium]